MDTAPRAAEAVGFSCTLNTGENRQVVFQTFFARDLPIKEANAIIDRMMLIVDRQKAKYEIADLEADLTKHENALSQFDEDLGRIELDFKAKRARRAVEMQECERVKEETKDAGYEEHTQSGKRGPYEPRGHVRQKMDVCDSQIAKHKEAQAKDDAERETQIGNIEVSRKRFVEAIAQLKIKIATRRQIVADGE